MQFGQWGEKQLDFISRPFEEDSFINIMEGSVRSGKTVAMIPKWIAYIMDGPPGLLLMTGVSKDTVYDNVLNDLFDTIGEDNYEYNRQSGDLTVKWKTGRGIEHRRRIKVCGAKDEGSEKFIRGKTLAGAYCDELTMMPERFFKQLINRLSIPGARLYATTNPDSPEHYLYKEYLSDERKIESGLVCRMHFNLDDNPNLSEEYKRNVTSSYSGMFYQRMILGEWVLAEGIIYDMWKDDMIFTDKDWNNTLASTCDRFIACDYGTKNPQVYLDIRDDGDIIYVLKEYYWDSRKKQRQKTDAEYGKDLDEFVGEELPNFIIIDPSAASFKAECQARGYRVKDADNNVRAGISVVASLMARRKLRVHESCVNLLAEFKAYVWDEVAAKNGKEQPVKQSDHACDALRYYAKTMLPKWRVVNETET
jgi:PBSX family phage terminase large subunit